MRRVKREIGAMISNTTGKTFSIQTGLIILVLICAFGVRLIEMRDANLWLDEAIEFGIANRPIQDVVVADRDGTHDPPFFSLMLNVWLQGGRNTFYLKMLPVILSVLAVAVTYVLGRIAFSPSVGLLSALIVAVAPRAVYYGQEVNQYALVLLLAVLCPLLLERFLKRPTPRCLLPLVLTFVVAILSHYSLALYVSAISVVGTARILWHAWRGRRRPLVYWSAGLIVLGLLGASLLLFYALPQKARLPATFAPVRYGDPINIIDEVVAWASQTTEIIQFLFWGFEATLSKWLANALLIVGGLVGVLLPSGRSLVAYLAASLVIGYVAAGFGFLVYAHRYVWYAFPLSALLASAGMLSVTWLRPRRRVHVLLSIAVAVALAILLMARLPHFSGKPFPETERLGDVVQYVEDHYQSGDVVYVYYGASPAFNFYAGEELARNSIVEGWIRGMSQDEQRARMWAVLGGNPRAWLVMSHVHADEDANLLSVLQERCRMVDAILAIKATGYLYDCAPADATLRHLG
jgi:uncharacterized membrane protein